jgi:hypothetical protein
VKNGQIFARKSTARGRLDLEYVDETSSRKVSLRGRADMEKQIGRKMRSPRVNDMLTRCKSKPISLLLFRRELFRIFQL